MTKYNQSGTVSFLLLPLIIALVLLFAAIGFGAWAFQGRQVYKNDTDQKIAAATSLAKQQQTAIDTLTFARQQEQPLTTYAGPEAYGSLIIKYPKTWSGYVDTTDASIPVNAYFSPGVVQSVADPTAVYALRTQVLAQTYSQVLTTIQGQQQGGTFTVSAFSLPKLPKVIGVEVTGEIDQLESDSQGQQPVNGILVVLPLRSETIELWTESGQYNNEFTSDVLSNFSFSP